MKHIVALTAFGQDRPGIAEVVTRTLYQEGCNIEDSSMTILCGDFTMILNISVPTAQKEKTLARALNKTAARLNLFVTLKEIKRQVLKRAPRYDRSFVISVLGSDRPGIVYRVSRMLASRGLNITDLNTRLIGTKRAPVYAMLIEAQAPPRLSLSKLKAGLSRLARRMNVVIKINPLEELEL